MLSGIGESFRMVLMKLFNNKIVPVALFLMVVLNPLSSQSLLEDKIIFGSEEMVLLTTFDEAFAGRIDTGAETSSIHAQSVLPFMKEGENWIRFNINHDGIERIMECPLESMIAVRQANNKTPVYRPLVKLNIQIGALNMDALFTLADRSRMTFPVLIGRNVLRKNILVDVSESFLQGN